jgi:putative transposase
VILDIYSRYVVGWTVQHQETAPLAERLIAETLTKQKIARHQLTIPSLSTSGETLSMK